MIKFPYPGKEKASNDQGMPGEDDEASI